MTVYDTIHISNYILSHNNFLFYKKKKKAKGGKQISRFINYLCSLKPKRKKRDGLMVNQNYIKHHQWPFFFYDTR